MTRRLHACAPLLCLLLAAPAAAAECRQLTIGDTAPLDRLVMGALTPAGSKGTKLRGVATLFLDDGTEILLKATRRLRKKKGAQSYSRFTLRTPGGARPKVTVRFDALDGSDQLVRFKLRVTRGMRVRLDDSSNTAWEPCGTVVGSTGAYLTSADGKVVLDIPPKSLSASVVIALAAPTDLPDATGVLGAVDLRPDGLTFDQPATLTLHYDAATLPAGYEEKHLVLAVAQGGTWVMVPAELDLDSNSLSARIRHFSSYGVLVPDPARFVTALDAIGVGLPERQLGPVVLTASDAGAGDWFGGAVAVSGDTAVVGAHRAPNKYGDRPGKVYVFVRSRDGSTWTQQAILTACDEHDEMAFGYSVAIHGDTAIVGAPRASSGPGFGQAYVFVRSGSTWTQQARLEENFQVAGSKRDFGHSVAISGDTVVVGAPSRYSSQPGHAHVFQRTGAEWGTDKRLAREHFRAGDQFGWSVAISGDTLVVGAHRATVRGYKVGAAVVFSRLPSGSWARLPELESNDPQQGSLFGESVAISGDIVLVGEPGDPSGERIGIDSKVHFFKRSSILGTVWQASVWASDTGFRDRLGESVAISGEIALAGAPRAGSAEAGGQAYEFIAQDSLTEPWIEHRLLRVPSVGGPTDGGTAGPWRYFGGAVSVSGHTLVVGARHDDIRAADAGAAYVYSRQPVYASVGNFAGLARPQGVMRVQHAAGSGTPITLATVQADAGTSFHDVCQVGDHALTVALTPVPPPNHFRREVRVYDISNTAEPLRVGTVELLPPEEVADGDRAADRCDRAPVLDVGPAADADGGVHVIVGVPFEQAGSALYAFDWQPGEAPDAIPSFELLEGVCVRDVLMHRNRSHLLLTDWNITPESTSAVRVLDAGGVEVSGDLIVPGGVSLAAWGETLCVVDHDGDALHLMNVSDPLDMFFVQSVSGVPSPQHVRHSTFGLFVTSATDGVLALDPDTFDPLPFVMPPDDSGGSRAMVVMGSQLLVARLSAAAVGLEAVAFD